MKKEGLETMSEKKSRLYYDCPPPRSVDPNHHEFGDDDLVWQYHSLPLGNGHFGASVYGYTDEDRIQITENSFSNPYIASPPHIGGRCRAGLTSFANIHLHFGHENIQNYKRELSLDDAILSVSYENEGISYKREYFTSHPDRVMAVKISANTPGRVSFCARIDIPFVDSWCHYEGDGLARSGEVHTEGSDIVTQSTLSFYEVTGYSRLRVLNKGGEVKKSDTGLCVKGADEVTLLFSCGTNYKMESRVFTEPDPKRKLAPYPHPKASVDSAINNAQALGYEALLSRHTEDYKRLYDTADISVCNSEGYELTTDKLVGEAKAGKKHPYLYEMLFRFARYLLICSSRVGCLPANLQGIWSNYRSSPWSAGYWHNINVQMNYWGSEVSGLAECFLSYSDYNQAYMSAAKSLADAYVEKRYPERLGAPGENGWIIGTGAWPYKVDGPGGHSGPGTGAFTSLLFWDYYDFTRDRDFLRGVAYPVLRDMSLFFSKTLVFTEGRYLVGQSASPEQFIAGYKYYQTVGCAFDQQMVYENYKRTLEAAEILGITEPLLDVIREQIDLLDPVLIGKSGQVKEFREEEYYGDIGEYAHRHVSHLVGLYPATHINKETPEWLRAAEYSLKERGPGSSGWSIMHRVCLNARAGRGDVCDELIDFFIHLCIPGNLWDQHPPFQIDGNLGYIAGVAECLIQSQGGYVELLPALPTSWQSGSFRGLMARGGFKVNCEYENGRVKHAEFAASVDGELRLKLDNLEGAKFTVGEREIRCGTNLLTVKMKMGEKLTLECI